MAQGGSRDVDVRVDVLLGVERVKSYCYCILTGTSS